MANNQWGKPIIDNVKKRGYIWDEENNTFEPPQSARALFLIESGINIPKKKNNRLRAIKTGWIDDALNIKNKSTKFDPFIALVKIDLCLEVWTEFIFSLEKNYKFDYAIPIANDGRLLKIGIEVDGGTTRFKINGHNSPAGLERDRQKSSLATAEGWRLIRVTPSQLCTSHTLNLITKTIQSI